MHRIGRTGRAGRSGAAVLFVSPRERHLLKSIERATRQKLIEAELPSRRRRQRPARRRSSATPSPTRCGAPGFDMFRRLIEDYERETTCRWPTSPRRWRCSRATARQFLMSPEPPPEQHRRDDRRPSGRAADASTGRRFRDLPHRRRQAAPGDARRDRRRHRQRRRTAPQRLRAHQHQARLLTGRTAAQTVPRDSESP